MVSFQYSIYFDVCALNRPYDDQSQPRIRLESEAIIMILNYCQLGIWTLINSNALLAEIHQTPNQERKQQVLELLSLARIRIPVNDVIKIRVIQLNQLGFSTYDAAHIASAEEGKADILLTTDDRLLKKAVRYADLLNINVANPIQWLTKVFQLEEEGNDSE